MALKMTLSRALACSRTAPCALRPVANRSRALMVRALKDDKEKQKSQAEQQQQKRDESTTAPARTDQPESRLAARTPQQGYELMPFRRMADSMVQMQREMDALLDTFGLGSDFGFARSPFSLMNTLTAPFAPALPRMAGSLNRLVPFEVEEDDTKYSVRVEVPGFTKSDVKVMVDPTTNMLTITGQKAAKEGETATSRMSFTRSFTLPMDVDSEKPISARTEHGVLTVELPKSPEAATSPKVKEIPVEGA